MKKIIASVLLLSSLITGTVVKADKLTLPKGEELDLGEKIGVYDSRDSFFGKMIKEELPKKETKEKIKESLVYTQAGKKYDKETNEEIDALIKILEKTRIYQLRSDTKEAYYQGIVTSVYVTNAEKAQITKLLKKFEKSKKERDVIGTLIETYIKNIPFDIKTSETKKSKKGTKYIEKEEKIKIEEAQFLEPLYKYTIIIKDLDGETYTQLRADQVSGKYLKPFISDTLKGI